MPRSAQPRELLPGRPLDIGRPGALPGLKHRRHETRQSNRPYALAVFVAVVAAACTSSGTSTTLGTQPATFTTISETPTTSPPETTSTTQAPTTTAAPPLETPDTPPETASAPPEVFGYAAIAEERARRLAIIDPTAPCNSEDRPCELLPVLTVELPERPHNLAGVGSVVYATHPTAGSISRIDIATGDILTDTVGTEPHDIEPATTSGVLYVADEARRRLLTVDAETLEVVDAVDLPAKPHDLAVAEDAVWVTLIGRSELARVTRNQVDLFPTSGSPHDLFVVQDGLIWFSNWGSNALNILDPTSGATAKAPAGLSEPHHFAIDPDGAVWVSDNGGAAVVGFATPPVTVDVGPIPHHLSFVGDTLVVAVSGSGQAVLVKDGHVFARSQLTTALHGIAVVELTQPLAS